ncbi:MAG: hypothetical protein QHH06_10485 [Clostridiales bacterium]|jgi:hypothetical protein|nr:hypothetical protein [Eubacteriales bacterium]MDH7566893.1 hypothetical protein [Clostridiales bacterium]
MHESLLAEIDAYCYMVQRGKPSAVIPVKTENMQAALNRVKFLHNLKAYSRQSNEQWSELWIYKQEYMLEVIKNLPEKPKTIFDHWVLGKAFGYSDEAIGEYVKS